MSKTFRVFVAWVAMTGAAFGAIVEGLVLSVDPTFNPVVIPLLFAVVAATSLSMWVEYVNKKKGK